jgi:hypothetical protein
LYTQAALSAAWLAHALYRFNFLAEKAFSSHSASSASAFGYQHPFQTFGFSSCNPTPSENTSIAASQQPESALRDNTFSIIKTVKT